MDTRYGRPKHRSSRNAVARTHGRDRTSALSSEEARSLVYHALREFIEKLRASMPFAELRAAISASKSPPAAANKPEGHLGTCKLPRKALELLEAWGHNAGGALRAELGGAMTSVVVTSFQMVMQEWAELLGGLPRWSPEALAPLRGWALRYAATLSDQLITSHLARVVQRLEQAMCSVGNIEMALEEIREGTTALWLTEEQLDALTDDAAYVGTQHGRHEAHRLLGATLKVWSIVDDTRTCKTCLANSAQGGIPMMQDFQSGHPYPPAHPDCRCSMDYLGITHTTAKNALHTQ